MKKIFACLFACFALATSACTSSTDYGQCIGVAEEANPSLEYGVSAKNVVLAVIFSETVVVPAVVIFSEVKCPVGKKQQQ